jgi:hypothetical protein
MFGARPLYAHLRHLWRGRTANHLVPLRIPETDFPEAKYDPHFDFVRLFLKDTERGAALTMVSAFGITLTEAIKSAVAQDDKLHAVMFRDGGALGTLGTKIKLGFLIRVYTKETMSDFERISRIRNLFAHDIGAHDFSNQRIRNLTEAVSLMRRAEHSTDTLVSSIRNQILETLRVKDLKQTQFMFMANVMFAASYLGARNYIVEKHGAEFLVNYSIF